jgi:hypothetical protein
VNGRQRVEYAPVEFTNHEAAAIIGIAAAFVVTLPWLRLRGLKGRLRSDFHGP